MSSLTQDENKELVHTNLDLIKYSTESFQNEKSIFNIFQSNYCKNRIFLKIFLIE